MQRFRSHSEHALDPKGRLNIPSRFREVLRERYNSEDLIVTHWDKCLRAYPVAEWEAVEEKMMSKAEYSANFNKAVRYITAGVTECQVDKQGRILLPQTLRNSMKIDKEVAVIGMLKHFEIWDKKTWDDEAGETLENFDDFKSDLANLGIL